MSNYWKKKLDELNQGNKKTSSSKETSTSNYWESKMTELEKEEERKKIQSAINNIAADNDIAPVKTTMQERPSSAYTTTSLAPALVSKQILDERVQRRENEATATDIFGKEVKKAQEERTVFKKSGVFEDGYDFGDITRTILGTAGDAVTGVAKGFVSSYEGITDLASYAVAGVADKAGADEFADDLKAVAQRSQTDKLLGGFEAASDKDSVLGDKADSFAGGIGQILSLLAGGAAAKAAGWGSKAITALITAMTGTSSMGSGMSEAYQGGATDEQAVAYGAAKGVIDAGTELIAGGLGKAINAVGISRGIGGIDDIAAEKLADVATKKIGNEFWKTTISNAAEYGVKAAAEGAEEVLAGYGTAIAKKATYMSDEEFKQILEDENLLEQFVMGALASGAVSLPGAVDATVTGKDYVTGYTQSEQAVIDAEVQKRIAEAENNGEKPNKSKIYDAVVADMEKGYIDTDTIESVLGGEDYTNYQNELKRQEDIDNELKELRNMKSGDMTDIQAERMAELKAMKPNTEMVKSLKFSVDEKVRAALGQNSRLNESYNERARRGQAYEADLSKYDDKQKAVIQKAIDSGILNNTNRTHEFVDMVAKISADKGVLFDFTNNAKLKESSFAVDGAAVNGYVTKDGITVNIDSHKAVNSVVGHEITHVLEGTELYAEMQTALFEYAKAKGDYQGRYDSLAKLYANVEGADVDAELTADLVGDYLFTDSDFINSLSTEHRNVFQKIYDEIKYLCKIATAGSKQARELERVKRAFDAAYKESGKVSSDTKYSISPETDKSYFDAVSRGDTETAQKMLDDAAKKAGYTIKAYHGTRSGEFYVFDSNRIGENYGGYNAEGGAFDFSTDENWAYRWGAMALGLDDVRTIPVYLKADKTFYSYGGKVPADLESVLPPDLSAKEKQHAMSAGYTFKEVLAKHGIDFKTAIMSKGYDSYAQYPGHENIGVYSAEQIKSAELDTTNPETGEIVPLSERFNAKSADIRFSLSDSDGKQLTKEQSEYFKDSKMRDENGALKVMYHGSQDAGFHVFDPSMSDDGTSLFFVDRNDVATTYSGTSETYEAKAFKSVEDANKFFASIGKSEYEVIERDGEYTLYEDGDEVATSGDLSEIYDEWRDWEGVGYGDANYKVYLNLTNPLEVDAKGRPWNKIDAEFSQEVYDRYASLTDEEKAALTDLAEWEDFGVFNSELQLADIGELASAYAKMGEDVNIYDLFSVAADNFSEDSMRENSRRYLKTRDFAQRAKEGGYDGVIFKNVIDNGGYSSGDEGASTVAIAFSSEQVKSVANEKPTGDPDIRYSLSEYTAEEKKAHNDAVLEHFGKTYKWAETGYLLLDGTKLDLSGKHDGAPGGYRTVDHRDITDALGYDYGGGEYSGSLIQFMSEGNIRIVPEIGGINLSVKPTKAQEQALSDFISRNRGEVVLDIDDLKGNTVVSVEYPKGTYYKKVLSDIQEWFDNGKQPETSGVSMFRSLTKEGETPKKYGNYHVRGEDIKYTPAEDVAPVQDSVQDAPVAEDVPDIIDDVPDIEPREPSLQELKQRQEQILAEGNAAVKSNDMDTANRLAREFEQNYVKIQQMESDESARFASLDDADAPPEVDAPYYAEREAITLDNDHLRDTTKKISDLMGLDAEDSAAMARVIQTYAQNPNITKEELFNEIQRNFQYSEVIEDSDDNVTQRAKEYIRGTHLYISPDLKADFNGKRADGYNAFRKEHFGHFHLTTNPQSHAMGVDQFYAELNEKFPDIFPEDVTNVADQLSLIGEVVSTAQRTYERVGDYDAETVSQVVDLIASEIGAYGDAEIQRNIEQDRRAFLDDIAPVAEKYESITPPKQTAEPRMKRVKPEQKTATDDGKIAKVLTEEPKVNKQKSSAWAMFKNNVLDKGMVFEDLALETGNRELQARWNSIRYAEGKAQRLMEKGKANISSLKSIRETVENSGKTQQFYDYLYHLHNVDRMSLEGRGAESIAKWRDYFKGLKKEQIQAIAAKEITDKTTEKTANGIRGAREYLNALDAKNKPVFGDSITADISRQAAAELERANPEFIEWASEVYSYMNYLREELVANGVISRDTAKLWAEIYPHYVPIRRAGKDGAAINVPLDTGRTGINAPIKRATGGNSDILPLFDTMGQRTIQTYRAIAKNRFGVELKNTLGTTIGNETAGVDDTIDSIDTDDGLLQEGKDGKAPTFTVFENGERVTFEITEEMYDAMKPTSKGLSYTNKVANTASNIFRGLLTEYNPVFMMTNAVKDAQDVLINSQHATRTYATIPKAIWQMASGGHWYQEYLDNGGERNTYFDNNSNSFKEQDNAIKKIVGMPLRIISGANNAIERVPRLAEYIASRESGRSVDVSMLDAARVTTNFAAGGDVTKFLNRNGFNFLNASMQGAVQQVRNVREAKANGLKGWVQLAAKVTLAGLPALLLNDLLWDDDEEYAELADYVKDNYYIVAKYGDGQFVRIPKGRTVAVIQDAFEQMRNLITGDDEVDLKNFLDLAITNLAPNNPLDNNIIAPITQAVSNKTWYGDDLVPTRLQDLPAAEQFDESTDAISKWLGEKMNVSPYKLNYLLNQYSGGVGDVFLPMLTPETDGGGALAPFKDKFTTDSVLNNQNVTDFYDTMDELTKNAKSSKATDEDILSYKYMNSVNSELGELYAQKREIQNSDLSDKEKREAVRELQAQIDSIARESLGTYGNVNIDGGYANVGDIHYRVNKDGEWEKITDKQLEKQNAVTRGLGISASEYWGNKEEYDYAYDNPEKYTVAKAVGGYTAYRTYSSELYDIKGVDEDGDGRSDTGTRKANVLDYINNLDADYGEKIILFKSEYNADDTYNYDIIEYLNSREDISYDEMVTILKELGFTVNSNGTVTW